MVTDIGYAVFLFIKQNPVSVRQFEPFLGFDETMDDGNLLQGLRCAVIEQNDHWFFYIYCFFSNLNYFACTFPLFRHFLQFLFYHSFFGKPSIMPLNLTLFTSQGFFPVIVEGICYNGIIIIRRSLDGTSFISWLLHKKRE